ncbi:type I pullulanase [Bacillus benzoevorans]|uniref:type I pullulanase n=1 Tax=Bacillus benzoevorans TaxID=1456 RepID=UPI00161EB600
MTAFERPFHAYLDEIRSITMIIPVPNQWNDRDSFTLITADEEIPLNIVEKIYFQEFIKYVCILQEDIEIGRQYWVLDSAKRKSDLQIGAITRTAEFDDLFYYSGSLGVEYSRNESAFKLWAPTASEVKLKLRSPSGDETRYTMQRGDKGVWSVTIHGNLEYFCYTYLVCVNLSWKEAVDPYATAATANGTEGVIVDLAKTRLPISPPPPLEHSVDSIIYETHLRDFTIHPDSGVLAKGTYIGAAEMDTKGTDGKETCLSYVKNLGITHLEILPINDFAGVDECGEKIEYNWGYNPIHFNVPDGSYSLDPRDPYKRIQELKILINSIHQNGLRVILDVVYNHVYVRETSSFEKIVPGYYFRHDTFGMPANGTGVGNDIASERKMVRKFIVDSVLFWLNEYHVDGFRFDLMGILDVETMQEVRMAVDETDPSVIIIGEGWDLNTPLSPEKLANMRNQKSLPGIGQFNDAFRDCLKGNTFNLYDKGYALGNVHYYEMAKQVISGSIGLETTGFGLFGQPGQSVNYVEAHDNHTLWDKYAVCLADEDKETRRRYHRLTTVLVLLSQGIPFLHSGQEFFRTKNGDGNSYRSATEINQLDWNRKIIYQDDVEYIKGIIKMRKAHRAFRFPSAELIRKYMKFLPVQRPILAWILEDVKEYGPWQSIVVLVNPLKSAEEVKLPKGKWHILADHCLSGTVPSQWSVEEKITMKPLSTYVIITNETKSMRNYSG